MTTTDTTTTAVPAATVLQDLALDQLRPHPHNVRRDLGDLGELAKSIAAQGVLEPLLVLPPGDDGLHTVVAGHRRLAAALIATPRPVAVPCVIRDLSEVEVLEAMLVENLQRADITPVEEAKAYARLVELDSTVASIARKVGRSEAHVKGRLALITLPDALLDLVDAGTLALGDAADLVRHADDEEAMAWIAERITAGRIPSCSTPAVEVAKWIKTRDARAALAAAFAELEAAGIPRISSFRAPWRVDLDKPAAVEQLELPDDQAARHVDEPCHAVHADLDYREDLIRTDVCRKPRRHSTVAEPDDRSELRMPDGVWQQQDTPLSDEEVERRAVESARNEARERHLAHTTEALRSTNNLVGFERVLLTSLLQAVVVEWGFEHKLVELLGGASEVDKILKADPVPAPRLIAACALLLAPVTDSHARWTRPDVAAWHSWLRNTGYTHSGREAAVLEHDKARDAEIPSATAALEVLARWVADQLDEGPTYKGDA